MRAPPACLYAMSVFYLDRAAMVGVSIARGDTLFVLPGTALVLWTALASISHRRLRRRVAQVHCNLDRIARRLALAWLVRLAHLQPVLIPLVDGRRGGVLGRLIVVSISCAHELVLKFHPNPERIIPGHRGKLRRRNPRTCFQVGPRTMPFGLCDVASRKKTNNLPGCAALGLSVRMSNSTSGGR